MTRDAAAVYFVRHAKAGDREAWTEDDRLRPLSRKGRLQAEALVDLLRDAPISRIVSSPYIRCTQTVQPLALDRGLPLELSNALAERARLSDVLELLDAATEPTVLCSHGDVIPKAVMHLAEEGMTIEGSCDWQKGSTWFLRREGARFASGSYLRPPSF